MSKTVKADWAATVPATGVQGLAAYIAARSGPTPDIGAVGGAGFGLGQVPVWNGTKFAAGNITSIAGYSPPSPPTPPSTLITEVTYQNFTPDDLRPLESSDDEFTFVGANPGDQIAIGAPGGADDMQISGVVSSVDTIRVTLTNIGPATITPPAGVWKIRIFK